MIFRINCSGSVSGLALGAHIFMLMTTGILVAAGYDLIPITFDRLPLDIRDNVDYLRYVAWQEKFEQWTIIGRVASSSGQQVGTDRNLSIF